MMGANTLPSTLSEAETLVQSDTSVYGAHKRKGQRHAEPLEDHDAAACTVSQGEALGETSALIDATSRRTLHVLARPQSSTLNAALYQAKSLHNVRQNALVLGPYGRPPDLTRFGIVLLVVEDIGIARVFSLIQELVLASEQHRAMVRKLIVVWQMEDLDNRRWVNMQHLLDLDRQEFKCVLGGLSVTRWLDTDPVRETAGASTHLKWVNSRIAEGRG
ncbi:uncharacterized protein KD926_008514 [Aspergillus affinis]|uniref:uncharacterized protein n=1 Tax=Aspergillus affinis TaxID=1070780 RepID=UPI0022FE733C|nr:uncharacterized protein KD926_008514 [Aspergillus affinis]KAI9040191.1 hypothetical protein KD926_008514 [Aspergillus affinis]